MEEHSYGGRRRRFRSNNICCVPQCYNRAGGNISLHKFPTHPILKKQWAHLFGIGRKLPQRAVACSDHFTSECFTRREQTIRRRLFHNALPSLNLPIRPLDKDKIKRRHERAVKQREIFARLNTVRSITPDSFEESSLDQDMEMPSEPVCQVVIDGEGSGVTSEVTSYEATPTTSTSDLSGKEMEAALTLLGLNMSRAPTANEDELKKEVVHITDPYDKDDTNDTFSDRDDRSLKDDSPSMTSEKESSDVSDSAMETSSDSQEKAMSIIVRDELPSSIQLPPTRRRHYFKPRPNYKLHYRQSVEQEDLNRRQARALKHLEIYARLTSEIESSIGQENTVGTSNEATPVNVCEVVIED